MDQILEGFASSVQAAAFDEELWVKWASDLRAELGSNGGLFAIVDRRERIFVKAAPHLYNPSGYEEYLDGMMSSDPQVPHAIGLTGNGVYTDSDYCPVEGPMSQDYYRWQEDRFGFYTHVGLGAALPNGLNIVLSMHFERERAALAEQSRRRLAPGSMRGKICCALVALVLSQWAGGKPVARKAVRVAPAVAVKPVTFQAADAGKTAFVLFEPGENDVFSFKLGRELIKHPSGQHTATASRVRGRGFGLPT